MQKSGDAFTTVGIDGDACLGKFLLHLAGFVAYLRGSAGSVCQQITAGLALVAAAQYGYLHACLLEEAYQVFGMGRLARAAHGQVTDADDRRLEALRREDAPVKELVAQPDSSPIYPRQGEEPAVYLYGCLCHLSLYSALLYVQLERQACLDAVALVEVVQDAELAVELTGLSAQQV